jgi:hypothetical protein
MINRWGIEVRRGLTVTYRWGRNGTDKFTGRVVSIDSRSSFARAYGAQVKITVGETKDTVTVCADDVCRGTA